MDWCRGNQIVVELTSNYKKKTPKFEFLNEQFDCKIVSLVEFQQSNYDQIRGDLTTMDWYHGNQIVAELTSNQLFIN